MTTDNSNGSSPLQPGELTDDDKARILTEEKYRAEVRKALADPKPTKGSRIWKFLNSAFALWFFSAILVGGGSKVLTDQIEANRVEQQRVETVEALDLEIGYRLSYVLTRLYHVQQGYQNDLANDVYPEDALTRQKSNTFRTIHHLYYPPDGLFPPLYPEYSEFGLPALVVELRRYENDPGTRERLTAVLRRIMLHSTNETIELPPMNWTARIVTDYVLERWTDDFEVFDPFTK